MVDINAQDFIEELRFDIKTHDKIKAGLVLSHFNSVEPATQKMALYELSKSADDFVIPLLVDLLAEKPHLAERHPPLKEVLFSKALDYQDT